MRNHFNFGRGLILLILTSGLGVPAARAAEDLVVADFRGSNFAGWKITGMAFGSGPATGEALASLQIANSPDPGVASSKTQGDGPTGTLTSPEFKIARKYLSFLISGGDYERDTCLNLLINGKVVRSATGWRSDRLVPASWDVSQFRGQRAQDPNRGCGEWRLGPHQRCPHRPNRHAGAVARGDRTALRGVFAPAVPFHRPAMDHEPAQPRHATGRLGQ